MTTLERPPLFVYRALLLPFSLFIAACAQPRSTSETSNAPPKISTRDEIVARAKTFELDTPYEVPPGDPNELHAAGLAKVICSAVFITGLDPDFARENLGFFVSPPEARAKMSDVRVDRERQEVHITLPGGATRTARYFGDQGCIILPPGRDTVYFRPVEITSTLPDPSTQPWPMGDVLPSSPLPASLDTIKVAQALDAAFQPPEGLTAAFVVTWRGRIIGERYGPGITMHTALESWSMGKSITATLMGILIREGVYRLDQPAPIPQWQTLGPHGDPRRAITIADLMHMSSGLRFRAPQDPDYDAAAGFPDHVYLYTAPINTFEWSATRPQQWPPNTVGRYRNCDPSLVNYLIRLGVESRGEQYLSFPQRALFDRLGMRSMVLETDAYGNFLLQGYEFGCGRDWARLGNLYLQDGVWQGERILPRGFVRFVSTVAPAWKADGRPIYGGFFWINGNDAYPIPRESYCMAGAGNQKVIIIPSHDLVVVRMGHYRGAAPGDQGLKAALALLMQAVPEKR